MRKLDHCNIVRLRYFFYSSGEKVSRTDLTFPVLTAKCWDEA